MFQSFPTVQQSALQNVESIFLQYQSNENGLTENEVQSRLKLYGENTIKKRELSSWPIELLKLFNAPFNYLLFTLGVVSYFTGSSHTFFLIAIMVLISVLLRFFQEYRSSHAVEKLQALVSIHANVIRQDNENNVKIQESININKLVVGDIVMISAGDLIPADIRLIHTKDLFINQSILTGETMPVEKHNEVLKDISQDIMDLENIAFMGSSVASGSGSGIIIRTGRNTYFGTLAQNTADQVQVTSFDTNINKLSWLLIRFILLMVSLIFLLNGLLKGNWMEAFLFALAVGVGLTPEMLPMIITTNLAKGAIKMSTKQVIVKRLTSIQDIGAMNILCIDKTGTLTQNKIILYKHFDIHGHENSEVLRLAILNSKFQTGLQNMLDKAILNHADTEPEHIELLQNNSCFKVDEIPFDFSRRRMSVIISEAEKPDLLICKGAIEEVLSVCGNVFYNEQVTTISPAILSEIQDLTHKQNLDGFRVIAIAYKEILHSDNKVYTVNDEENLTLLGYISFLDPPKETAPEALKRIQQLGIEIKILTGDNAIVTEAICKIVELPIKNSITGKEIEALNMEQLGLVAEKTTIFAKLTPEHKQRIIKVLQEKGNSVGFMGDGINDAPALKASNVGISVNNAVDIAKESADLVLLEQNLLVLIEGITEGRRVIGNILKYIRMNLSSNFGNVVSITGASIFLPFLPMLPIQILVQNLMYDFSQTAMPFDSVDKEYLLKPQLWHMDKIQEFMLIFGPVSSLFDYITFAIMWFIFDANTITSQARFQSGWFIEGLLSQILIIHLLRTRKIPFLESNASPVLFILTILIMLIGISLPYTYVGPMLGLTHLPYTYFLWLMGILFCYFMLAQVVKTWFIKRFGF